MLLPNGFLLYLFLMARTYPGNLCSSFHYLIMGLIQLNLPIPNFGHFPRILHRVHPYHLHPQIRFLLPNTTRSSDSLDSYSYHYHQAATNNLGKHNCFLGCRFRCIVMDNFWLSIFLWQVSYDQATQHTRCPMMCYIPLLDQATHLPKCMPMYGLNNSNHLSLSQPHL